MELKSEIDDSKCNLYHKSDKNSSWIQIQNPYGGIPQNLLTNLIGIGILLSLFLILRKSAWKVINHIVPKNDMDRWNHIFFSFSNTVNNFRRNENDEFDVIDPAQVFDDEGITESRDNAANSTKVIIKVTKLCTTYFCTFPTRFFLQLLGNMIETSIDYRI